MGNQQSEDLPPQVRSTDISKAVRPSVAILAAKETIATDAHKKFTQEMAQIINKYRALHQVPAVKVNDKLSCGCQEWADRMAKSATVKTRPRNFNLGENIYYSRWATDAESVCKSWYKEGAKYSYDKEPNPIPVTNVNFTQLIWKDAREIGVGISTAWNHVTYIVVDFKPKGNTPGEYRKNVLPPSTYVDNPLKRPDAHGETIKKNDNPKAALLELNLYQKRMLQLINEFRDTHTAKPLRLNTALCGMAQKHTENMAEERKMLDYSGKSVGVSLYCSKWYTDPKDPCQFWYAESKRYKYIEPNIVSLSTVNFVQMVWNSTREVGFGRTRSNGYTYVAAFYRPPGNVLGEFAKNVQPFRLGTTLSRASNVADFQNRKSRAISVVLPNVS